MEGIVLGLLGNWCYKIVLLCNQGRFGDLASGPLGGSPVISQIQVADDLSEALHNLLHWCSIVRSMSENYIDVWLLKTFERALQTFDNVLAGKDPEYWALFYQYRRRSWWTGRTHRVASRAPSAQYPSRFPIRH